MCHIYASTDPARYGSTTHSVRLQGYVTSVRLENEFWEILETLAVAEGITAAQFISKLYGEVVAEQGSVANLTSMLRVACAIYLRRQVDVGTSARSAERLGAAALATGA